MTGSVTSRIGVLAKGNDSQLKLANISTKYFALVIISVNQVNYQHCH